MPLTVTHHRGTRSGAHASELQTVSFMCNVNAAATSADGEGVGVGIGVGIGVDVGTAVLVGGVRVSDGVMVAAGTLVGGAGVKVGANVALGEASALISTELSGCTSLRYLNMNAAGITMMIPATANRIARVMGFNRVFI